jgi:hypothetical protein
MVVGLGFGTIVTIVALVIVMSFKVLREYQRAVVFMLVPVFYGCARNRRILGRFGKRIT